MNGKHTPGPWECHGSTITHEGLGYEYPIASTDKSPVPTDEAMANARLIAAAPDLAAALAGCASALREAGKDFAAGNPLAARPNLYELHAMAAMAALEKAGVA